jgi:hypothetical protein
MLLSLPTWIIHILTVSEWLVAIILFARYGRAIDSTPLRLFALCMVPHFIAGAAMLLYHAGGDRWDAVLAAARALTFVGSLLLLAAATAMLPWRRGNRVWWLVPPVLAWGFWRAASTPEGFAELLPVTNSLYIVFLVTLLFIRRSDPSLFSRLSVAGFWFLLVFVAVTLVSRHVAVELWGLPSLTHADVLHGASEAVLSVSNLMIALGAHLQLRRLRATGPLQAARRAPAGS